MDSLFSCTLANIIVNYQTLEGELVGESVGESVRETVGESVRELVASCLLYP